jgi:hypothetical protein
MRILFLGFRLGAMLDFKFLVSDFKLIGERLVQIMQRVMPLLFYEQ